MIYYADTYLLVEYHHNHCLECNERFDFMKRWEEHLEGHAARLPPEFTYPTKLGGRGAKYDNEDEFL